MLVAVKKNREVKIEETEKEEFLKNGFEVVEVSNDKVKNKKVIKNKEVKEVEEVKIEETEKGDA